MTLQIENVTKRFGDFTAVDDLSLLLAKGRCMDSSAQTGLVRQRHSE